MKTPFKQIVSMFSDTSGNVVVPAAVAFLALTAIVGGVIDLSAIEGQKKSLQVLADNAALSAAREFAISANNGQRIEEAAKAFVTATANDPNVSATVLAHMDVLTVDVTVRAPAKTFFPGPAAKVESLSASATARLAGEAGNICMIGLSPSAVQTVALNQKARLTAQNCAIYSNSTNIASMRVSRLAEVVAEEIYTAGGYVGRPPKTMKPPVTDAPQIDDPLASRPAPRVGMCDAFGLRVRKNGVLYPGTYCGGLNIDGGSVELRPGIYIIKDGPLRVDNGGSLVGENVGFYLTGDTSKLYFNTRSTVDLTAPKTGVMAGLLFFSNWQNATSTRALSTKVLVHGHVIRSDNARRLVGTVYLPDDKLVIDGNSPVADKSEYTVIIAKAFQLNNGPNLVLQTDYDASDIPVPDGVGPMKESSVRLLQ